MRIKEIKMKEKQNRWKETDRGGQVEWNAATQSTLKAFINEVNDPNCK